MAKGVGLIGNFKGKVGNTVGYNLKDSNNKQTQGIRVYQPIVKNPKSAGQAEQRARMAVINATYRALKDIICRGQEGIAYGNKSRLAWLSDAMKQYNGAWIQKGEVVNLPAIVPLTKGTLRSIIVSACTSDSIYISVPNVSDGAFETIGALSTAFKTAYTNIQDGDQITLIALNKETNGITPFVFSFVVDTTSTVAISGISATGEDLTIGESFHGLSAIAAATAILSREGSDGAHLRSKSSLLASDDSDMTAAMTPQAKAAAIASYMTAGVNADWEQDPED